MTPAIYILNNIDQQILSLENYKLSKGQCEGLKKAFTYDTGIANRILIDNCGVTDEMLSILFQGAANLKKVKTLNLCKTEIGLEAAQSLKQLF